MRSTEEFIPSYLGAATERAEICLFMAHARASRQLRDELIFEARDDLLARLPASRGGQGGGEPIVHRCRLADLSLPGVAVVVAVEVIRHETWLGYDARRRAGYSQDRGGLHFRVTGTA